MLPNGDSEDYEDDDSNEDADVDYDGDDEESACIAVVSDIVGVLIFQMAELPDASFLGTTGVVRVCLICL